MVQQDSNWKHVEGSDKLTVCSKSHKHIVAQSSSNHGTKDTIATNALPNLFSDGRTNPFRLPPNKVLCWKRWGGAVDPWIGTRPKSNQSNSSTVGGCKSRVVWSACQLSCVRSIMELWLGYRHSSKVAFSINMSLDQNLNTSVTPPTRTPTSASVAKTSLLKYHNIDFWARTPTGNG